MEHAESGLSSRQSTSYTCTSARASDYSDSEDLTEDESDSDVNSIGRIETNLSDVYDLSLTADSRLSDEY